MTRNNNLHKTIWKNWNEKYNEKYICCFFTIWNLKTTITYKCRRVVPFLTSVYFAISKLILLFLYSFHVPCIILSNVYFYIVRSMFPFPFNWSQSKASVVNQMNHLFGSSKIFFCSFQLFENGHIHNFVTLDFENNSILSTLFNVVDINVEIENVDLTLLNVVNFNVDIHNVVSALIWYSPTSRRHITLTTTFRPRWKVSWVLTNVAKRHNFVKFIKLKTNTCSRMPLNCCFYKLLKRYW